MFSFLSDPYFANSAKMLEQIMLLLDSCIQYIRKTLEALEKEIKKQNNILNKSDKEKEEEEPSEEGEELHYEMNEESRLIRHIGSNFLPRKRKKREESKVEKEESKVENEEDRMKKASEALEKAEKEKKRLTDQVSQFLSEEAIKQLVKALVRGDCSEDGAKYTISIMNNMATILPEIRKTILKELSEVARMEAHAVVKILNSSSRKREKSVSASISLASTKKLIQELKFCRVLKTYTAVLKNEKMRKNGDKKDAETTMPEGGYFLKENSLDFVWEALEDYLSNIPDDDEQEDKEIKKTKAAIVTDKKSKKKKSTTLYGSLLPLVEAFFSFHAAFTEEKVDSKDKDLTATMETTPTSLSPKPRVELFLEKNRRFLNALVRSNPSLLNTTLSLMMKYPRYVDFDNKRSWFRAKLDEDQRMHPYSTTRIEVRRDQIFVDSYYQLRQREPDELKARLNVKFKGEEGVDAGGVTREWFSVLSKEMLNPNYALFIQCADKTTYQPNPASHINGEHLNYFKFIGRVIAMAIYHQQHLECYFTRSFYKHILGIAIKYQDIESIDPDYYKNLKWMLDNDIDGVLDYTFTQEVEEFGQRIQVELKPNGKNIPVTNENKHEYVRLVTELKMTTSIKQQLNAFLSSFFEIIPKELISVFNEQELELLMCGLPEVDVNDLRNNTEYIGYTEKSPVIQWFWKTVEHMNRNDRALLLQFVTGTSKVPLEGFKSLLGMHGIQRFTIQRTHGSDRLPTAHTCFNLLDLPEYESEQQLSERLMIAIREGSIGFGFA